MKAAIVIPARYGSSRFPGKPLATISGMTMLERMWRIARAARPDLVVIATDDERIATLAKEFGAEAVMTRPDCANGTERVYEALKQLSEEPDIVLNLQGDAVLTPPWILTELIDVMGKDASVQLATPAVRLTAEQYKDIVDDKNNGIVGGTFVVFDNNGNALYFSKSPIPYLRNVSDKAALPVYRHIGLYAYRFQTLQKYLKIPMGILEATEGLEQLRALENGIPIRVVVIDYKGRSHWSVDNPTDVTKVEAIIASEGELCGSGKGVDR